MGFYYEVRGVAGKRVFSPSDGKGRQEECHDVRIQGWIGRALYEMARWVDGLAWGAGAVRRRGVCPIDDARETGSFK